MITLLQKHLTHYPKMQIQDVAKLCFQSEFGGGHMILNEAKSFARLQQEYASLDPRLLPAYPLYESIGNGLCRIYLSAISQGLQPDILHEMFVQSARSRRGTIEGLKQKLDQFLCACQQDVLPFQESDVRHFLQQWELQGYPAIHHSESYRQAYHPAYRVVEEQYLPLVTALPKIHPDGMHTFIIAIDGMSGSGKSTLGTLFHRNFPNSNLFHMDDFFLQQHQRTEERLSEIGGNVDYERFQSEILLHLDDKHGLSYRPYSCKSRTLGDAIHVSWKPITIIEGSYSHHPYFQDYCDLRITCKVSPEEQKMRIIQRNGEEMWERFEQEWIPKENTYFEAFHIL